MKGQLKKSILQPKNFDILTRSQKEILKKLKFINEYGFYLAGGTGLALYLGHRTSIDFDFYSQEHFPHLPGIFERHFKDFEIIMDEPDTLILKIKDTSLSFFCYPYGLIREKNILNNIFVASLEDISAMKIVSIVRMGNYRDFVDIYFLIKNFGLRRIIKWIKEKFPSYSTFLILKGLTYFEDAEKTFEENKARIKVFENIEWKEIKKLIQTEAQKFVEIIKKEKK